MAYETGSAADLADLLDKLSTFAQANGWTEDELDDGAAVTGEGRFGLSKSTVFVTGKYDSDDPETLSLHQALAYDGFGSNPGEHTDDSGNGYNASASYNSSNLEVGRCVYLIGNGPFPSYHFFEDDNGSRFYLHAVVEISTGIYRHFGFGELEKSTDWTGGEYVYGHYRNQATGGSADSATNTSDTALLDGIFNSSALGTAPRAATIHAEGLPHQGGSEKWLQVAGGVTSFSNESNWQDTAGESKRIAIGGFRGGPVALPLGQGIANPTTGFLPSYALNVFTVDFSNSYVYHLGVMPDVRGISIQNFSEAQEVTIGSDTWVVFPTTRRTLASVVERSQYQGIAYKKVTT